MVIVPVDPDKNKAEQVAQKDRDQGQQGFPGHLVRGPQFQHHNCDNNRQHPIAERFETTLTHRRLFPFSRKSTFWVALLYLIQRLKIGY
jgi:hypothetical protein